MTITTPTEFWTLNDTLVGAIGGNTLVSVDGLTHYTAGKLTRAWDVANDANRRIAQDPSPLLFGGADCSCSLWFYVHTAPSLGTNDFLLVVPNGTAEFSLFLLNVGSGLKLRFNVDGTSTVAPLTVTTGAWHHAVGVYTHGAAPRLYLDGVETIRGTVATVAAAGAGYVRAGYLTGTTGVFNGVLDAIGVWNAKALTAAEVSELYALGTGWEYGTTTFAAFTVNDGPLAGQYTVWKIG
jgi:hypothetical protein